MNTRISILVADRNPHVRKFLKRELEAEGHSVRLAENGVEVLKVAFFQDPLDLVILDPDLPGTAVRQLLAKLKDRIPPLPVVIHTFLADLSDSAESQEELHADAFVEKGGNSIETLKQVVLNLKQKKGDRIQ